MSEKCSGNCESCKSSGDCKEKDFRQPMNQYSSIKKVIGVVSGKGGVGKSLVTTLLACALAKKGAKVAVLDADVTGPSIPKSFGIHERAKADETGLLPSVAKNGVKVMSVNLLLEDENAPVVWRGPVISGVINQFWTDVNWGDVDYMFVDMPPGTGDVALTVFQGLPLDGIIVVSTPQELVKMIVNKALTMAKMMKVPVLGIVENMSYFKCDECGKTHRIFGESNVDEVAEENKLPVLAKLPIDPKINRLVDDGRVDEIELKELEGFVEAMIGE